MRYAMLSTLIPPEMEEDFLKNSSHTMQDAANVLQWHLYEGFCSNIGEDIPLFNVMPAGSFPQYYRRPLIFQSKFGKNGVNIGFCNIKLIRNACKSKRIYSALKKWCKSVDDIKILFVYTIASPFLKAVTKIKQDFPTVKICAIVADLPDMTCLSDKKSLLQSLFSKRQSEEAYGLLSCIDAFVLLTKYMADYMHIEQPYCVVEGIASVAEREVPVREIYKEEKIVLYAGTLHRKFGVLHLLEAFRQLRDDNFRLWICGVGDSESAIKAAAGEDTRIVFMGQLPRSEVLQLQKKATLVVNPRQNNEEFTKYSFPSKNMEYLSSGKPLIAYKLDGIPDEYDPYIFYPADNSAASLAEKILEVAAMPEDMLIRHCRKAYDFVLSSKNHIVQTKKILELIGRIV